MPTRTTNRYGKITMSNKAIRDVAELALRDCYGVARGRVVDIYTPADENRVYLTIKLTLMFGPNPETLMPSIRDAVKYAVEQFTGMKVAVLNLSVTGIS